MNSLIYLLFICFWLSCYLTSIRTESAYSMMQSITTIFESNIINSENKQYTDIVSKLNVEQFITNVVIEYIYNESLKDYMPLNPDYHYLSYYNFFMGLRITQNRVQLMQNPNQNYREALTNIRKINYSGDTKTRYGNLDTSSFGSDHVQYWSDWGYDGSGGFVHFFDSSMTLKKAKSKFNKMVSDGLFNESLLDITLEIMSYNENYQTGTTQVYQFLINNSGNIEKYKDTAAFYLSRYSKNYHQSSENTRRFLILLDVLYCICLVAITVKTVLTVRSRTADIFHYRAFTFKWFEVLDVFVLGLSYTNLIFWILIFCVFEDVTVPFTSESKFQDYVSQTDNTKSFCIVSSVLFFLLATRLFRTITERFPSFGALFETVKVAFRDLLYLSIAVFIILIGFSFATCIYFGSTITDFKTIWNTLIKLIFVLFGDTSSIFNSTSIAYSLVFKLCFLIFIFAFWMILMKMFITIVIVRYKYLRSAVQIDNEAHARILAKKGRIFKQKLWNFLTCKRRALIESDDDWTQITPANYVPLWRTIYLNFRDLYTLNKSK